jgi:hypothetical protein
MTLLPPRLLQKKDGRETREFVTDPFIPQARARSVVGQSRHYDRELVTSGFRPAPDMSPRRNKWRDVPKMPIPHQHRQPSPSDSASRTK